MYGWRQNRPDLDQIVPDESFLFIGPIIVLNRLEKVIGYCLEKCWKTIADQKPSFRGRLGRDRQRADETWGPSDDYGTTVFDRLLFFNIFKNRSRSLVRYPTLRGLRRSGQMFDQKRIGYYRDQNNPWWNDLLTCMYISSKRKYVYCYLGQTVHKQNISSLYVQYNKIVSILSSMCKNRLILYSNKDNKLTL